MFFLQAAQAPVQVVVKSADGTEEKLSFQKMTIDELVEWGSELQQVRFEDAMKGLDEPRQREARIYYASNLTPPTVDELIRRIQSPDGIREIIVRAFRKIDKEDQGNLLLQQNGVGRLAGLAYAIADILNTAEIDPFPKPLLGKPGDPDPLTSGGKQS